MPAAVNERVRKVSGATLFVLDDEGVFFFEPRQELYVFNTTATFVWCCLEEGFAPAEIARTYADAFGLDAAEATRQVHDLLNQWWGLGYIEEPGIAAATPISLVTALSRLLANPVLRRRFAASPATLAKRMGVRECDDEAFRSLDTAGLDLQAERSRHEAGSRERALPGTADLFSSMASADRTLLDYALACRLDGLNSSGPHRSYRLMSTTFDLRFGSDVEEAGVHPALAHLTISEPLDCDVCLDIVGGEAGYCIIDGSLPLAHCPDLGGLAPRVKALLQTLALNRERFFLELHAGVVSNGTRCVVLPGAPGSGKTTLTAALVASGMEYFSDEVGLLAEETLELRPVPLGLGVKPGAVQALAQVWPMVRELNVHSREDGQSVRYLSLPPASIAPSHRSLPAGWLVFPHYHPEADTALRPMTRPQALRALMHECMVLPRLLDERRVDALVQWISGLQCFALPMSSLSRAVRLVRDLCGHDTRL